MLTAITTTAVSNQETAIVKLEKGFANLINECGHYQGLKYNTLQIDTHTYVHTLIAS